MDTDSLSFRYEEHFPVFGSSDFLNIDDESQSTEETASDRNCWEWEVERELNGDVALIPMSSELGMNYLSNSPPIREDFQKIMSEWQHLMNIEIPDIDELPIDMSLSIDEENITYVGDKSPNTNIPASSSPSLHLGFSSDSLQKKTDFKVSRPSGKKIDMSAQCYIVEDESTAVKAEQSDDDEEDDDDDDDDSEDDEDEDCSNDEKDNLTDFVQIKTEEIDTEINELCPKLEPHSLEDLEQNLIDSGSNRTDEENDYVDVNEFCPKLEPQSLENLEQNLMVDSGNNLTDGENDYIDVDTISNQGTPILQAGDLNSLLEQFEATETTQYFEPALEPPADEELFEFQSSTPSAALAASCSVTSNSQLNTPVHTNGNNEDECDKNKQILNALPQELIMRIKASSKRKMIPVIDPIPAKRRGIKKTQVEVPQAPQDKVEKCTNPESIQLDHDYCCLVTPYPKHPKKDSGFESAEEDEQRNILRNQPTVKGADGKLMVSLLKINTIRNSVIHDSNNKKKRKLNLEEYKKRREGVITSCDNSQNNSPSNSGRNSPLVVENENERLLKHQQKLMQMAAEVLKTPAKSACKSSPPITVSSEEFVSPIPPLKDFTIPPPPRIPPDNVEVKVLVSMGVNTDSDHVTSKQFDVPVTELEEIKPLLQNANAKISNNSLITSVIENIQNKKKAHDTSTCTQDKTNKPKKEQQEHGEDKTIVYLDKNRPPVLTISVEVQTDIVVEITSRRDKRRRNSSSSSDNHGMSGKQRSSSNDSHYSYSSHSSSSSASRSRSPSPRRIYNRKRSCDTDRERVREVEERRIVYVGGISSTMTKEALRRRFQQYGPIINVSVHFREYGDNYGFVTFAYKVDAYEAVEHANDDPTLPHYDLSFGGRRIFCRTHYSDLDNVQDEMGYGAGQMEDSFDNLLREAQAKLRKRKSST